MNFNLVDMKCKKCQITLSDFEYMEKKSLCIDCYNEEYKSERAFEKPRRLRNKKIYTA